jgi:phosphotransferase system HPr (HPr) family protein
MNGPIYQQRITVNNPRGLHLRPAAAFAALALRSQCSVWVAKDDKRVDGTSALDLIFLHAPQGSELLIEVSGPDAASTLEALVELLDKLDKIIEEEEADPETPLPQKG